MELLLVFIGGGVGAALRYLITLFCNDKFEMKHWATFLINIFGCFFLGAVLTVLVNSSAPIAKSLKLFLATGIAGGFTTFSTYSYESYVLIKYGKILKGFSYIIASLVVGILAIFAGILIAQKIFKPF